MKVKKLLSAVVALAMAAGIMVIPQMNASAETYSYSADNGWTLAAATDNGNGSLTITGNDGATFKPGFETGKIYTITYNVSGLVTIDSDGYTDDWAYPFRVKSNEEAWNKPLLAFRMASGGRWTYDSDQLVSTGTDGSNAIVIDTKNNTVTGFALGKKSKTETINNLNNFSIQFLGWASPYATISDFKMTVQSADMNPTNGYYYYDDFESTDAAAWMDTYKIDSGVEGKVTYAWGTEFSTETNGNHAIKKTSGDIYMFNSTPREGAYVAKFDLKPEAITADASTDVFSIDLAARWYEHADLVISSDSSGAVNKLTVMGSYMTIDPAKWTTVEVTRDYVSNTIVVKAEQNGSYVTGIRAAGAKNSDFTKMSIGSGHAYFDNISVVDKPVTDVYYSQDFGSVINDFDTWRKNNVYTPSGVQPFQMWGGSLVSGSALSGALDIYPLAVTPRTGKYELAFDIKPNASTHANGTNWDSAVMQFSLGSSNSGSWHDMKLGSSAGASQTGVVTVDRFWVFGNAMTIDPTQWIHITAVYDCSANTITARASQGSASAEGTAGFSNDKSSVTGSPKTNFVTSDVNVDYQGVYLDNVVIRDYVTPTATAANDGNGTANVSQTGNSATFTAAANSGYTFDGWYNGETKVSDANPYTTTIWEDTTLTAKFTQDAPAPTAAPVKATAKVTGANDDNTTYRIGLQFDNALNPSDYKYIVFKAIVGEETQQKGGKVSEVIGSFDGDALIAIILDNAPSRDVSAMFTNASIGIE